MLCKNFKKVRFLVVLHFDCILIDDYYIFVNDEQSFALRHFKGKDTIINTHLQHP